jgi:hypothetical protein
MNIDSDFSNLIFVASVACMLMGQPQWAMYLIMMAIYVTMMENGISPLSVKFHRPKEAS